MKKVLLFAGAGASAELGIPTMRPMADQFLTHLENEDFNSKMIEFVKEVLKEDAHNMEHLFDEVTKLQNGASPWRKLVEQIDDSVIDHVTSLNNEVKWFIQHTCEKFDEQAANFLWRSTLKALDRSTDFTASISTTNYDRAIETAAKFSRIILDDGFGDYNANGVSFWKGLDNLNKDKRLGLIKVHGSTNWYEDVGSDSATIKLRHAIPLYGELELRHLSKKRLASKLILPTLEKGIIKPPFEGPRGLLYELNSRANEADYAFFIGSSLNDDHIKGICIDIARNGTKTFIVNRNNPLPNSEISFIKSSASTFLISTLPKWLSNPEMDLIKLNESQNIEADSLLKYLTLSKDSTTPSKRLTAIEKLSDFSVSLDFEDVSDLLNADSEDISTCSLGLVSSSKDKNKLMELVKQLMESKGDQFKREAGILLKMEQS